MVGGDVSKLDLKAVLAFLRVCSSKNPNDAFGKVSLKERIFCARFEVDLKYKFKILSQIQDYIEQCSQGPVTYQKKDQKVIKSKDEVPMPLSIVVAMTSKLGFTQEESWTMPVGQCAWILTAYGIQEGAETHILSTDDEANAEREKRILIKAQEEALKLAREEAIKMRNQKRG